MVSITIKENSDIELPDEETLNIATQMLAENPKLPIHINNYTLSFDEYTIGSIQLGDYNIEITPRNETFSLSTIFEMILFESLDKFDDSCCSVGYSNVKSFGISVIASQFLDICTKLVEFGLTGNFIKYDTWDKNINGVIIPDKFHKSYIPIKGLYHTRDIYTIDIIINQIIKSAIRKIISYLKHNHIKKKYILLLKNFNTISDNFINIATINDDIKKFHSTNPHYPLAIELAKKILQDMKIKYSSGNIKWSSFLYNSNDIYERYIRKVVTDGIDIPVQKWNTPHKVAILSNGIATDYKSYVPDIVVGYDNKSETAKVVLDAKNKRFEPNNCHLSNVLNSSDMYQMVFYCNKLHTRLGGLIYPAKCDNLPITVSMDNDVKIMLFSINMSKNIFVRHKDLCDNIKKYLLSYI